nr:amidohydrolase family protein [Xenophilus sp. Marseille-Q4582]
MYDPGSGQSISALAASQGMDEVEFAYDLQLANDGKTLLYSPFANYAHANLDACQEMVQHPHSLLSLGDGGAHVGLITDSSSTTFMLTHWVKQQGLPLEWAVQKLTSLPAEMMGLKDRGVIKQGMKADLNIIDLDRLEICFPYVVSDLPAGGTRFTQDSDGYLATFLSGKCVVREGKPTGLLPGRLVRSHSLVGSNN